MTGWDQYFGQQQLWGQNQVVRLGQYFNPNFPKGCVGFCRPKVRLGQYFNPNQWQFYDLARITPIPQLPQISDWFSAQNEPEKPKTLLGKLRYEIDSWHGDILKL